MNNQFKIGDYVTKECKQIFRIRDNVISKDSKWVYISLINNPYAVIITNVKDIQLMKNQKLLKSLYDH